MMATSSGRTRRFEVESLVGYILLAGLLTSVALLVIGIGWHWWSTRTLQLDYSMGGMNLASFIVSQLRSLAHRSLSPRMIISLGISVLMLTPYLRVLASLAYFSLVEHNLKYSCFTGLVLAILTYSLFLG